MSEHALRHCHLRFRHDMVFEFPFLLPRGVMVAQVTLDHFVMVRIHARQPLLNQGLTPKPESMGAHLDDTVELIRELQRNNDFAILVIPLVKLGG